MTAFGPGSQYTPDMDLQSADGADAAYWKGRAEASWKREDESAVRILNLRERLDRAKAALVSHGPFTEDEVDDDIAPRIIEMSSRSPEFDVAGFRAAMLTRAEGHSLVADSAQRKWTERGYSQDFNQMVTARTRVNELTAVVEYLDEMNKEN